jgi:predicted 2-oxoglutarate/Fe(II)-dependent dioxygenase YbiX
MQAWQHLLPGDPFPRLAVRGGPDAPDDRLDTVAAGRYVVVCFLGSAGGDPAVAAMLAEVKRRKDLFDDVRAAFFAVSSDPADETTGRLAASLPGFRPLWDFDLAAAAQCGLAERTGTGAARCGGSGGGALRRCAFVLDPGLRVLAVLPMTGAEPPAAFAERLIALVAGLSPPARAGLPAPVLVLPRVFEPDLCRTLIDAFERSGGGGGGPDSGGAGQDRKHPRRRDCVLLDETLRGAARQRIERRVVPMIRRAFQFDATRLERYLVACYDAAEGGGHFRGVRRDDAAGPGVAHRRFAVAINLNAEDYEGGDLAFPEFGPQTYRAPTGGAVVFSCSLLHEARPVTSGRRFAFLPFLHDEAAQQARERRQRLELAKAS